MLPPDGFPTREILLGELDGDGDLDAVLLASGEASDRLYRNDGNGVFDDASGGLPDATDWSSAGALGDVDVDGDLDLVVGNTNGAFRPGKLDRLLLNDGDASFTDATIRLLVDSSMTTSLALADFDADGDPDLLIGAERDFKGGGGQNRLALNSGIGVFVEAAGNVPAGQSSTSEFDVADFDGDGDLDVLVGGLGVLYVNDGTASFSGVPAGFFYDAAGVGDVDGDLDVDVYLGHERQDQLELNDGSGRFTDATSNLPAALGQTADVALGDVDGDGDLDVLAASLGGGSRLYRNGGGGLFSDASAGLPSTRTDFCAAVAVGDVDGDSDLDVLFGTDDQDRLFLNDGDGVFGEVPEDFDARGRTFALGLVDLDGDADLDLLVGNGVVRSGDGFATDNRLYSNDGSGNFSLSPQSFPPVSITRSTLAIAVGDVDLDGDVDAYFGNALSVVRRNQLYLNDGSGGLTDVTTTNIPPDTGETIGAALGDLDGDGDLDAVTANGLQNREQNRMYLNNGSVYTDATASLPVKLEFTHGVDLGDIDGDGDLDIVFANGRSGAAGRPDDLYANDGTGAFSDVSSKLPSFLEKTFDFAFGDVDADGDLDLLEGNLGGQLSLGAQNRLYLNDGTGLYADATSRLPAGLDTTTVAALVDVDLDGDLDAWFGNVSTSVPTPSAQDRLYLNDGAGNFSDATALLPAGEYQTQALAFGDIDADGDVDCVVGTKRDSVSIEEQAQGNRILRNVSRQFAARGLPRIGKPLRFEMHGPAGGGWALSGPFGRAGSGVFDADGRGVQVVAVPLDPGLIGLDLGWSLLLRHSSVVMNENTRITGF